MSRRALRLIRISDLLHGVTISCDLSPPPLSLPPMPTPVRYLQMGILMRHTALWLLAAAVLLPHALARPLSDPSSSESPPMVIATAEVLDDIASGNRRQVMMNDATRAFKCLNYSGVEGFAETTDASITVNGSRPIPVTQSGRHFPPELLHEMGGGHGVRGA